MGFIKKFILKRVIKHIIDKLETYEAKEPQLRELRSNLYGKSMGDFVKWGTNTLVKNRKIPDEYSFVDYVRTLMEPLDDGIENTLNTALTLLDPRKKSWQIK